ncbi:hypothetical protein GMST_21820 [Geomonas silvestris]|uniref:Uncharacterized protein n=1 Tax=Geomonas silvestris TaxID=2740184 RepID=A0A6V8MIS8_9BACT|nr:chemotaxis protein CheC [Geomonas silvestris]GFO59857.1 hypothetical protein GMST_21820 [Geomonas silvestris]
MNPKGTFQAIAAPLILRDGDPAPFKTAAAIALRQAAGALEQLLGAPVRCEEPRLGQPDALPASGTAAHSDAATLLSLQILGDLPGSFSVVLSAASTRRILELLLHEPAAPKHPLSELELSALQEVGNILGSACLNALGEALHLPLLPSPPVLRQGEAGALVAVALGEAPAAAAAVILEARVLIDGESCPGSIYLAPKAASWQVVPGAGAAN